MRRFITQGLNEVSLHDSSIERYTQSFETVEITLDWAKLTYKGSPLIVSRCVLTLEGVTNQSLRPNKHTIDCIGRQFSLIGDNESESDQKLTLGGFYEDPKEHTWIEWSSTFSSFRLEWYGDVTLEDWQSGKLPPT